MITIGIPSGGSIKIETFCSIISCIQIPPDKYIFPPVGGYVIHNRKLIAEEAIKTKSTHVMFIDADMIFGADAIGRLIEADKDIIGCNYNQRGFPLTSTVKLLNPEHLEVPLATPGTDIPKEPFKCFSLGTGFMLIKTEVFDRVPKPWFMFEDNNGETITEDVYFCRKAREQGIDVWCDPTITIRHIGEHYF